MVCHCLDKKGILFERSNSRAKNTMYDHVLICNVVICFGNRTLLTLSSTTNLLKKK